MHIHKTFFCGDHRYPEWDVEEHVFDSQEKGSKWLLADYTNEILNVWDRGLDNALPRSPSEVLITTFRVSAYWGCCRSDDWLRYKIYSEDPYFQSDQLLYRCSETALKELRRLRAKSIVEQNQFIHRALDELFIPTLSAMVQDYIWTCYCEHSVFAMKQNAGDQELICCRHCGVFYCNECELDECENWCKPASEQAESGVNCPSCNSRKCSEDFLWVCKQCSSSWMLMLK
jgi:hypothetical protein